MPARPHACPPARLPDSLTAAPCSPPALPTPSRLLELPPPEVDALGRPAWPVSGGEVSKAYRKLSVLVHPDKNPGEEARQAFEALNEAHRVLKDQNKLVGGWAGCVNAYVSANLSAMCRCLCVLLQPPLRCR